MPKQPHASISELQALLAPLFDGPESLAGPDGQTWVDAPLLGAQRADHPIFADLASRIPGHLTPAQVFEEVHGAGADSRSVLSMAVPSTPEVVAANAAEKKLPAALWLKTKLWNIQQVCPRVREVLAAFLEARGARCLCVTQCALFAAGDTEDGPRSNWSERHIAYASGLGTFGLNGALITERGVAHRLMSVVTDCAIEPVGEVAADPFGHCLYRRHGTCGACIRRCPIGAITADGHAPAVCAGQEREIVPPLVRERYDLDVPGCGLCMTGVPCATRNPCRAATES